jgi:uncharacterized protein YjbI with pentapeptide repeats
VKTTGPAATRRRLGSTIRYLLTALASLVVVIAALAAGIGIYAAAPVWQPLLLAWWPGLLFGAAIIVAPGAWWLWWRLPKRQVDRLRHAIRDPKARTDVEDNFRKTIGQLLGGVAVLAGAGIAYVQFTQQQKAGHDLLISNQVSKGFEQLGNDKVQVRLGGIYALEGVMNDSERYHQPVLEALCAFVRNSTQSHFADSVAGKVLESVMKTLGAGPTQHLPSSPATDVQAALTVIGRREAGAGRVDLRRAFIPGAALNRANLSSAYLNGVNLNSAFLSGATLNRAFLNHANLSRAWLVRADLSRALLSDADLSRTTLNRAELNSAFLSDALLNDAGLSDADLSSAYLKGANLGGADLSGANLKGADLSGAHLRGAENLTQDQADSACGDEKTELDPPLTIKQCPSPD